MHFFMTAEYSMLFGLFIIVTFVLYVIKPKGAGKTLLIKQGDTLKLKWGMACYCV